MASAGETVTGAAPDGRALSFHFVVLGTFFAAAAAPTPIYHLYQEEFGLSPLLVTAVFAVYAVALLKALLLAGSISDHLGRRPVIFAALVLEAAAMALFVAADGFGLLITARIVQGIATGIAVSSVGAAVADIDRVRGQLVNSLGPLIGMALGALGTGALVQYGPHPLHLVYGVLAVAFAAQAGLLWLTRETGERRAGALRSLRPRIVVPPRARRTLAAVTPINMATWMLGGFYLSLIPSLIIAATGSRTPLTGGGVVAALMVAGSVAVAMRRTKPASDNLTGGTLVLIAGLAVVLGGMHAGSVPVVLAGTILGGAGFGTVFLGTIGTIMPLAAPDERAGLLSALYIESYLAFSVPAVLAGYLVRLMGYTATADIYAAMIAAMCLAGLAARRANPAAVAAR
jgi:MFS family permease